MPNLRILPESFATGNIHITNSNKCLLCSEVLKEYRDTILDNEGGCIFKIVFNNALLEYDIVKYVVPMEFTAPKGSIIVSNSIFEELFIDFHGEYFINVEPYVPPQGTRVVFELKNRDIFEVADIKKFLETSINKQYTFLQIDQEVNLGKYNLRVSELEPHSICLINSTDLEVEFKLIEESPVKTHPVDAPFESDYMNDSQHIVNTCDDVSSGRDTTPLCETPQLSREELRLKRLKFYT
tara:strand:+ start:1228 stop:1944 length:717 start_codon:yes stop_codon:yes gene_type:complete